MSSAVYDRYLKALPADWKINAISEIATVVGGGTPSRDVSQFWRGSIPWVTPGEISSRASVHISSTRENISMAGLRGSGAMLIPPGSLMITTRATLGARAINLVPMATNQGFKSLVFKEPMDAQFYYYLVDRLKPEFVRRASGTTFLEISGTEFGQTKVPVPPISERALIAEILATVDTTIRQTDAMIEKLKLVKKGLLQDLLTRGIDVSGALRPPQREAPHLYKDSPLGWIPTEWSAGPLSDWLDGNPKNGYSPQEAGRWTGVQMLGLGCLTPTGFQARQLKNAPAGDMLLKSALLMDGDLLISRANTRDLVGLVGIYRDVGTPCHYPDLMMRLRPTAQTSAEFLELVLSAPRARRQIQSRASGTSSSMVKISGSTVANLCVAIPTSQEQVRICNMLRALNNQLERELQFNKAQQAVKLGLMDDFLTGRVRITPLLDSARVPT